MNSIVVDTRVATITSTFIFLIKKLLHLNVDIQVQVSSKINDQAQQAEQMITRISVEKKFGHSERRL